MVKAGADVNITDDNGNTLLFHTLKNVILFSQTTHWNQMCTKIAINVRNNEDVNALTYFVKYCLCHGKDLNERDIKESVKLLSAAGDTVDETKVREDLPKYLKPSADINLMNICRENIRKHLLQVSDVNLFCSLAVKKQMVFAHDAKCFSFC